jgi:uncharacterized phiE125 gp8 family phage protein
MTTNYFFTKNSGLDPFVTLAQAKAQLRIEESFNDEDALIAGYIDAATEAAQDYLNKRLFKGVLTFECSEFKDPFVFTQSDESDTVESVEYYAKDGDSVTLTPIADTEYKLRRNSTVNCKEIKFKSAFPAAEVRDDAVVITINQGFEVADLPKPIFQAILLMITSMYEKREDMAEAYTKSSHALLRAYRNF